MGDMELDAYLTDKDKYSMLVKEDPSSNSITFIKYRKDGSEDPYISNYRTDLLKGETPVWQDGKMMAQGKSADGKTYYRELTEQSSDKLMEVSAGASIYNPRTGKFEGTAPLTPSQLKASGTGGLTINQKIDAEMSLMGKAQAATKLQQEVVRNVNGINSLWNSYKSSPNKNLNAVSQAIITSYGKILDPGSVVRESEYARTPEGLALVDKAIGYLGKLEKGGAGLTEANLQELVDAINTLGRNAQKDIDKQTKAIKDYGQKNGLDTSLIGVQGLSSNQTSQEQPQAGEIKVKITATGEEGFIPANEFDSNIYTKI